MKTVMLAVLMIGVMWSAATAQSPDMEFTPGPRMIRAVEQIAGYYAHLGHSLGLTAEQKEAIVRMVQRMKTDMWLKEAVLVGMFQELEEKRRHGLLQDNEYRIANTLTGGIETDELNLFIDTLAGLHGVLTADQQAKVREASHPAMEFRLSQGFNTKIGLMSLESIGRVYNGYRYELRLSEAQAHAIESLLEDARREVLRPDVNPEVIRTKMAKNGETEGVLFNKIFAVSDQIEAQLTEEQRKKLAELKQNRRAHAGSTDRARHVSNPHGERSGSAPTPAFDYFLDQTGRLGLTPEQIAALVAAKNETRKTVLIEQAKLKGAELELLGLLRNGETPAEDKLASAVQGLERVRSRITQAKALGYVKARQLLTREQQQRVHPPQTFEDGQ